MIKLFKNSQFAHWVIPPLPPVSTGSTIGERGGVGNSDDGVCEIRGGGGDSGAERNPGGWVGDDCGIRKRGSSITLGIKDDASAAVKRLSMVSRVR